MADRSVYVYAVGPAGLTAPDVPGVDGTTVRVLTQGPLAALVSDVDRTRFGEDALRQGLEDLRWLETLARAHDGVVAAAGGVAPLRMATIYLDDARVHALLRDRADEIGAALDRIRGRTEWGVKAFTAPSPATPDPAAAPDPERPGTSYLMRRRATRDATTSGRERALDAAAALHGRLAGSAVASRRYPPQDPRLSGRTEEMVLNAAYLVDGGAAEDLRALAADSDAVLHVELTGPWAPYSFATLDHPEER